MNSASEKKTAGTEMPFLEHLEVLRWHIIRSVLAIVVLAFGAFMAKDFIFDTLIFGPTHANFFTYRVLCRVSEVTAFGDALCIKNFPFRFINTELAGQFMVHLKSSMMIGLILSFPYIFWEFWRFVRPALYEKELGYTRGIVFFTSILFLIGVLFGYFLLMPTMLNFLGNYQVTQQVENTFTLTNYLGFLSLIVLSSGIIFELPMVVYFFSKIGLLTPGIMRTYRKHAIIGILVLSAVITPSPDVGSQIMVFVPVYFLYEISIFISARVAKNREADLQNV